MPLIVSPKPEQFQNFPNIPDCDKAAVLEGDPKTGPSVMKGQKPVRVGPGDFAFLPSHHAHRFTCISDSGCEIFVTAAGAFDIHYVDEAGNEIDFYHATAGAALEWLETAKKELRALVDFLKSKGVDLRPVNETKGPKDNVIGHRFTMWPDYDKGYKVGFSYRPGVTEDCVAPIAIAYAVHGDFVLWRIETPDVVWEKVLAAFKEYRGGARNP